VPDDCVVLAGTSFALLRQAFPLARQRALSRRSSAPPVRLLVSMGFTDVAAITRRVVEGAVLANLGIAIDVVTGREATSLGWLRDLPSTLGVTTHVDLDAAAMSELMVTADVAIGAGGGTGLERCCLGLPGLTLVLADNQRLAARALANAGATRLVGDSAAVTAEEIASALTQFCSDGEGRLACARAAAAVVDGGGTDRVTRAILEKLGSTC